MKRLVVALVLLVTFSGCAGPIKVRTYPPGAVFTANDRYTCKPVPCDLNMQATDPLHYKIRKDGYVPAEGTLKASVAPGRMTGAFFTLGFVALVQSIFYYPETSIINVAPASDPGAELAPLSGTGTGRVEGQAFTKTLSGELRHAAANTIGIRPDTLYVRDAVLFQIYKDTGLNILTSEPDLGFLEKYVRKTTGDAEGRFTFENLPAGKYVLTATITWHASERRAGLVEQQVEVFGETEVREGETARVIVTDVIEPEFLPDWRRRHER